LLAIRVQQQTLIVDCPYSIMQTPDRARKLSKYNGLDCHLTVIWRSYNDDMGRVGIPPAGWIVDQTGPIGGAPSAPTTNLNKSLRLAAVGMTRAGSAFGSWNRREA